nr:hypothetical protein [uncultured Undibacterium sp.]
MTEKKYAEQIHKTGFVLEFKVAELLREVGWTVISNKYYEDDFEGSVREIDLLAYKVKKVQHVDVYTTLLISCKKSEHDVWALLAREINLKDPNSDWWPLHAWSNDKAIDYEIGKPSTSKKFHELAIDNGVVDALSIPTFEVFAFQEMNKVSGAPKNDKNIFQAVTSLMKAQAYELSALPRRKKKLSLYQFNLISVIDSELVRLVLKNDDVSEEIVSSEHYISRYIIKKTETVSRIRFVSFDDLKNQIVDYSRLHDVNSDWCNNLINGFYDGVLQDVNRTSVFLDDFREKARWVIWLHLLGLDKGNVERQDISVGWNPKENCATVILKTDESVVEILNNSVGVKKRISTVLKEIYRYDGNFVFEADDIPF